MAAGAFDKAMQDAEAESAAGLILAGGEEGFEDPGVYVRRNANAGVGDGDGDEFDGLEPLRRGRRRIEEDVAGGDTDLAALWHGSAGVDHKIEQR